MDSLKDTFKQKTGCPLTVSPRFKYVLNEMENNVFTYNGCNKYIGKKRSDFKFFRHKKIFTMVSKNL